MLYLTTTCNQSIVKFIVVVLVRAEIVEVGSEKKKKKKSQRTRGFVWFCKHICVGEKVEISLIFDRERHLSFPKDRRGMDRKTQEEDERRSSNPLGGGVDNRQEIGLRRAKRKKNQLTIETKRLRRLFKVNRSRVAKIMERNLRDRSMYPPPPNVNPFFGGGGGGGEEVYDDPVKRDEKKNDRGDDEDDNNNHMMISSPTNLNRGEAQPSSLQLVKPFWSKSNGVGYPSPPKRVRISRYLQDYQEIGIIGSGSFGIVTKCRSRLDGCIYAIKKVILSPMKIRNDCDESDRYALPKEIFALSALEANPHVTRYFSSWVEGGCAYLVLEMCEESLQKYVDGGNNHRLDEQELLEILRQSLEGLAHLHRHNVVHMDIKPGNILVKRDIVGDVFKLGDLGLAHFLRSHGHVEEGDTRFVAPEMLATHPVTTLQQADIFSLGATVLSLALGCDLPKNGTSWHDIRNGRLPALPPHFSVEFTDLVSAMMSPDPTKRPTTTTLLKHPLLEDEMHRALSTLKEELSVLQRKNPHLAHLKPGLTRRYTF